MKGRSFIRLFPSDSFSFSSNAGDAARQGLPPEVYKHANAVAVEMRRWAAVGVYVLLFFFPPFLLLLLLLWLSCLAFALASHDDQLSSPLCALLVLSLKGTRREGQSQMAENSCGWMCCWWRLNATVYTSQLPLRSRLNSVKPLCLHAPLSLQSQRVERCCLVILLCYFLRGRCWRRFCFILSLIQYFLNYESWLKVIFCYIGHIKIILL